MFNRLSLFLSVTFTGLGGIRIRFTPGTVAAIIAALLGSLGLDLIDLLQFAA